MDWGELMDSKTLRDWLFRGWVGTCTVLIAVVAYQGSKILSKIDDHEQRLTTVEAKTFSQADGAVVVQAIADLRKDVAVLNQSRNDTDRRLVRIEDKLDVVLEAVRGR